MSDQPHVVSAERLAQLMAHRACHSAEHDPLNGKIHGYCMVCGIPWPCEYAGTPPAATPQEAAPVAMKVPFNHRAFGLSCTIAWTELVQALRADGHDVKDKSGPTVRKWIEGIVRDTFAPTPTDAATTAQLVARDIIRRIRYEAGVSARAGQYERLMAIADELERHNENHK